MNPIFADLPTTIFEVMSSLARDLQAINLGQGFPDDPGPQDVRARAADAVLNGYNQYPSMMGIPELRQAISAHYKRFQGLDLDADREVLVTSGATEAIAASIFAVVRPGDEVVLLQPMYDAYLPLVRQAGGIPKFVTLKPPHWTFSEDDLAASLFRQDPRGRLQQPAQSDRRRLRCARAARPAGEILRAVRRHRHLRRGLGACRLRRSPPCLDDGAAADARAHGQDRLGRQDFLSHGLEGRARRRRAASPARSGEIAPVPHVHHAAEPATRGRLRAGQG
jgi:hypothetical protein